MTEVEREMPALIRQHIRSVWALEILLLLRSEPERSASIDEIVRELRASGSLVGGNLRALERSGLVVGEQGARYRYQPASPFLAEFCERIEHAYRERPVAVINLIAAPEQQLQKLADAFRLRGPR